MVEESKELKEVLDECNFQPSDRLKEELEHEIGDLLFSVAQLSRWLKVSPEDSLRQCCNRFLERFSKMEESLGENAIADLPTKELEEAWQKAKTALKNK